MATSGVVFRPVGVTFGRRHAGLGESAPILTNGRAQLCKGTKEAQKIGDGHNIINAAKSVHGGDITKVRANTHTIKTEQQT